MNLPTRLTLEEMAFEIGRLIGIADRFAVHARDEEDANLRRDFSELANACRSLAEDIRDTMLKLDALISSQGKQAISPQRIPWAQ